MTEAEFKRGSIGNWTSSSNFFGYHADFYEGHGTVRACQRRTTACVKWRWGMAGAQRGICELALIDVTKSFIRTFL